MNVYELQAKIGLDTSGFDRGLKTSKKSINEYRSDVMKLAQTYKQQGMSMSDAMKRAYAEIDKSQYESTESSAGYSKKFAANWTEAAERIQNVSGKIGNGIKIIAKAGVTAVAAGAAALTALGTASIKNYAEYEQLVGGVETLFKQSADTVMGYAENAYKTAGLSANEYMSTVTSFSASLISSLGGDTAKAAELANRAITDMSDNANKMGTDMSMIQNAYQGFAKQNYTMLDNLKLGYGGTQEEMKRLVKEAANMTNAQKALGVSVDGTSLSFANIVDAISVVQYEMGIYGTTTNEAEKTITGSINAMKGAWQNLVTAFSDPDADLGSYVDTFVESVIVAKDNIVPRIRDMLPRILDGFGQLIDELGPEAEKLIGDLLPSLISGAAGLVANLIVQLPGLLGNFSVALKDALVRSLNDAGMEDAAATVESAFNGIQNVIQWVIDNSEIFTGTFQAIYDVLSGLVTESNVTAFFDLIQTACSWIVENKDSVVSALEGIAVAVGLAFAVGGIMNLINAISMIFSPLGLLLATVVTVAAGIIENWDRIKLSWDTMLEQFSILGEGFSLICDDVKQWFSEVSQNINDEVDRIGQSWEKFTQGLTDMKDGAAQLWEEIKQTVNDGVEELKSFLNFEWSLPKLKLPHFTVSGSFSLNPPSIPTFGVSWYKKAMDNAMILNGATIFGRSGNTLLGGGEVGKEVVSGADTLMNMIHNAVVNANAQSKKTALAGTTNYINITVNGAQYDDEEKLARRIAYVLQCDMDRRA